MDSFVDLIRQFGPWIALVALFVWQGVLREQRMSRRLDDQGDLITQLLTHTISRNTQALVDFTHVISLKPCGVNLHDRLP